MSKKTTTERFLENKKSDMKRKKVINNSNLPGRLSLIQPLVFWLVLERLDAAGWVWGVVGCLVVIIWILQIVGLFIQDQVDILK